MTFIRAPYIENVSDGVEVLASVDNHIVAAKYNNQIGLSFHPELTGDTRIHEYFLSTINSSIQNKIRTMQQNTPRCIVLILLRLYSVEMLFIYDE